MTREKRVEAERLFSIAVEYGQTTRSQVARDFAALDAGEWNIDDALIVAKELVAEGNRD